MEPDKQSELERLLSAAIREADRLGFDIVAAHLSVAMDAAQSRHHQSNQ